MTVGRASAHTGYFFFATFLTTFLTAFLTAFLAGALAADFFATALGDFLAMIVFILWLRVNCPAKTWPGHRQKERNGGECKYLSWLFPEFGRRAAGLHGIRNRIQRDPGTEVRTRRNQTTETGRTTSPPVGRGRKNGGRITPPRARKRQCTKQQESLGRAQPGRHGVRRNAARPDRPAVGRGGEKKGRPEPETGAGRAPINSRGRALFGEVGPWRVAIPALTTTKRTGGMFELRERCCDARRGTAGGGRAQLSHHSRRGRFGRPATVVRTQIANTSRWGWARRVTWRIGQSSKCGGADGRMTPGKFPA